MSIRVDHVLGMAPTRTDDFNCWGATRYIADPSVRHLEWCDHNTTLRWLKDNYTPVKKGQPHDIVALFDAHKHLLHTAYRVGPNKYVHKLGRNVARVDTLAKVLRAYNPDGYIFFKGDV